MRTRSRIAAIPLILTFLTAFAGPAAADDAAELAGVLDRFDRVQDSIRTLTAELRVTNHHRLLVEPEVNVGRLYLTKPAALRWAVAWHPNGFVLVEHLAERISGSEMPMEHIVYSDGLASMSVFIELLGAAGAALVGHSRVGAINAFGRVHEGHQITVVGEVPPGTVERVGMSVTMR